MANRIGGQYRVLKLDCEWSEWRSLTDIKDNLKEKEFKVIEIQEFITKEQFIKEFGYDPNLQNKN